MVPGSLKFTRKGNTAGDRVAHLANDEIIIGQRVRGGRAAVEIVMRVGHVADPAAEIRSKAG